VIITPRSQRLKTAAEADYPELDVDPGDDRGRFRAARADHTLPERKTRNRALPRACQAFLGETKAGVEPAVVRWTRKHPLAQIVRAPASSQKASIEQLGQKLAKSRTLSSSRKMRMISLESVQADCGS